MRANNNLEAERYRLAEAREKLVPWYRWGPYEPSLVAPCRASTTRNFRGGS